MDSAIGVREALATNTSRGAFEGFGKKVGPEELEKSDAVTEKYFAAVVEVAAELDGDAGRLIAALRERKDRLSGYRSKSAVELLHQWWTLSGGATAR
jgi:hypothetical protein